MRTRPLHSYIHGCCWKLSGIRQALNWTAWWSSCSVKAELLQFLPWFDVLILHTSRSVIVNMYGTPWFPARSFLLKPLHFACLTKANRSESKLISFLNCPTYPLFTQILRAFIYQLQHQSWIDWFVCWFSHFSTSQSKATHSNKLIFSVLEVTISTRAAASTEKLQHEILTLHSSLGDRFGGHRPWPAAEP